MEAQKAGKQIRKDTYGEKEKGEKQSKETVVRKTTTARAKEIQRIKRRGEGETLGWKQVKKESRRLRKRKRKMKRCKK